MSLRDPHVFIDFISCRDVTDTLLLGYALNNALQTSIQTDSDGDGFYDMNMLVVFRPLDQAGSTAAVEFHSADNCSVTLGSCAGSGSGSYNLTATNAPAGQCLTFLPGTVRPYTPVITSPTGPCFSTNPFTLTLDMGGIPLTLSETRVAASYSGNPATGLTNGLISGFISEIVANNTILPASFPLIGGQPLSRLLAGGVNNCAAHSDKDTNGVVGWWFYFNFSATQVPYTDF